MDERLLAAVLVAPFVITMVGFAVAIAFAPAVPNEISPATEHDHEEMDHGGGPGVRLKKARPAATKSKKGN